MSRNLAEHRPERELINTVRRISTQNLQQRTLQQQGSQSIQVGYTPDSVLTYTVAPNSGLTYTVAPNSGLIGTFLCTLQYDAPIPDSVVFGELDIAVNKDTDVMDSTHNLSAYYGGLTVEVINDLYLEQSFYQEQGYHPIVKVVKLRTFPSSTESTFYIHTRWRYVGVGNTLEAVTGDIGIVPESS